MAKVRFQVSVSLDGYLAGPDQSLENPLGLRGEELHEWMFPLEAWRRLQGETGGEVNASTPIVEGAFTNVGAYLMGRNMFGGGRGPWRDDPPWTGWWGDDPPYHRPVFVLTKYPREPLEMLGGTTFRFVTDGAAAALRLARAAAGDADVVIAGGAATIQQYLAADEVDAFDLNVAPVVLGAGERLLEGVPNLRLEQIGATGAPGVTHLSYRVKHG